MSSLRAMRGTIRCATQCTAMYHELNVTAHDIELVLHGELAIEVQQNKGHPGETHGRAGQDAAPQGTVEGRLLHRCSHLLQQGVGSEENTERTQRTCLLQYVHTSTDLRPHQHCTAIQSTKQCWHSEVKILVYLFSHVVGRLTVFLPCPEGGSHYVGYFYRMFLLVEHNNTFIIFNEQHQLTRFLCSLVYVTSNSTIIISTVSKQKISQAPEREREIHHSELVSFL